MAHHALDSRQTPASNLLSRNRRVRTKKRGARGRPFESHRRCDEGRTLRRIVHLELDWMRSVLEADDLLHLQLHVAVDEIVVEPAAGLEEVAVLVEIAERLAQASAHGRALLELRRLSDCAPNRRAAPAPRSQGRAACRSSSSGW